jgi:hypothetical protein
MSMSQEEIEALMNGLDIEDDDTESEEVVETVKVNTKEIEELLSQTEDLKEEINEDDEVRISLDDIANIKGDTFIKNSEIESLLNDIESSSPLEEFSSSQDILNDIHSVDGNEAKEKPKSSKFERSEDDIVKDWTSSKINEGIFPLPAEKDTKVVNQLSQVANDSEEKVSQIFDVLSLTLDNNNDIRATLKSYENFISSQVSLLVSLNNKFPNIKVFDEHLANAKNINSSINNLTNILNNEDSHIFQAMELMQFNDINRQKIERVMSVIRKLSLYLNNLFEDDGSSKDVAVAKHIHGDENNDLIGDDLDKLIAEFSNNK